MCCYSERVVFPLFKYIYKHSPFILFYFIFHLYPEILAFGLLLFLRLDLPLLLLHFTFASSFALALFLLLLLQQTE